MFLFLPLEFLSLCGKKQCEYDRMVTQYYSKKLSFIDCQFPYGRGDIGYESIRTWA